MVHPHSQLIGQYDNVEINISSLAAITGVLGVSSRIDGSRTQGFRTVMQKGNVTPDGLALTAPTGGPLLIGFADGGLSLAEIEEKLEADPQSSVDVPSTEQQKRRLFILGYCNLSDLNMLTNFRFTTKHKWSFIEGVAMNYFAYNTDLTTALPATSQLKIHVEHIGVWLRD